MKECIDYVFCIDGTGSMTSCIEAVKSGIQTILKETRAKFEEYDYSDEFAQLRAKIIVFRDFAVHGERAMEETRFFVIPDEAEAFDTFLNGIKTTGEAPLHGANALEAISLAIKSDWTPKGTGIRSRHCILVVTDTYPYPLQARAKCPGYPEGMPADLDEFKALFDGDGVETSFHCCYSEYRSLIVCAPNGEPWTEMQAWNSCWHCAVNLEGGLNVEDYFIWGDIGSSIMMRD